MDRKARDMMKIDEMYKEILALRGTVNQLKKYGEELIEVKPHSWFPKSNTHLISNRIGKQILLIIRGDVPKSIT